jgi:cytochrome c peroxidase
VGNCVACHAPPLFTDFSFHNIGVSQAEYDSVHGQERYIELAIPDVSARRPIERFRMAPERGLPERVDLGHWNFIHLGSSPLRRQGESDDELLQRMIGAFKTPTLRHLAYSYPYFHNGAFTDLLGTLREKIRLSELARARKVRAADDELLRMRLSEADLAPLVKFLDALNEELRPLKSNGKPD